MDVTTGIPALDAALVWGGAISVLGTVGTVAWRVVRTVTRFGSRAGQFLDDWYGEEERAGVHARPGVMLDSVRRTRWVISGWAGMAPTTAVVCCQAPLCSTLACW